MRPLPTGTVTFLFTDIEGSAKLWESSPEAMRSALARHDQILRDAIEANGGFVFKTVGDAFCAAFDTAPQAVAAALAAQAALYAEPWQVEPPVRARMALHTGATEERGGDYYGPPVNRVARLLSAGYGGQTLLSLVTQELIRDSLPPSVALLDLGDAGLKDLARPERVYQLQHADLPAEFPPPRALNSPDLPNNLPQQPTSFIGREKELAEITTLLQTHRLLTLAGAGGAGKTRLALQAAADLLETQPDGVWLIELAPLADPALVPTALAQVLGVQEISKQPLRRTLASFLRAKTVLVILDNCEHLIQACAELAAELLGNCPNLRLLATSREPLSIPGEQVSRVASLSVPSQAASGSTALDQAYTAESLSQYDSVRLFVERAKAAQPSFAVTDRNAPALAQICYSLDGIPLAIELAAARVRSLPVEQVNARLGYRFRLLTGGARTLLPRQQTLRALIDWSYDLLNDSEKATPARLSIFAGGWTLDAAEAVCAGGEARIEEWEALDLLTSLTDKSLVTYEEATGNGGEARYALLETIRHYALERLEESGALDEAGRRHRDWCLQLAQEGNAKLFGPDAAIWLSRLDADHDNLRAALTWCGKQDSAAESQSGLQLSASLANFWRMRGYYSEGRQWTSRMLERAAGDNTPGLLALRAKGINAAASLAYGQGDFDAAVSLNQESLAIARSIDDKGRIANVLNNLGNIAFAQRDFPAAAGFYEEGLLMRREIGLPSGIASALGNLGLVRLNQGDIAFAEPLLQEGLELMRE